MERAALSGRRREGGWWTEWAQGDGAQSTLCGKKTLRPALIRLQAKNVAGEVICACPTRLVRRAQRPSNPPHHPLTRDRLYNATAASTITMTDRSPGRQSSFRRAAVPSPLPIAPVTIAHTASEQSKNRELRRRRLLHATSAAPHTHCSCLPSDAVLAPINEALAAPPSLSDSALTSPLTGRNRLASLS